MADPKLLDILKQGPEAWRQWKLQNSNATIDLVEADLRELDLTGYDLSNSILLRANLGRAILTNAHLMGTTLKEANLRGANLEGADLRRSNLSRTTLVNAKLTGALLSEAKLRNTYFIGANLKEANLSKAKIDKVDLTEAELDQTQFGGAVVDGIIFGNNDLSSTLGLESVQHLGPSPLDMGTIRRSKGTIPVVFLRGCGFSDLDIEFAKLAKPGLDPEQVTQITYEIFRLYSDRPIQFYSCFISYNSRDQAFAQRLHDDLQEHGVRCWFAPEDLKIGDEFRSTIGKQIRLRDKLLIILSENSINSEWVGDEVEKALAEEKELRTYKLFPIRLDDAVMKASDDWAEKIRLRRHIGDFSGDYAKAFEKLLRDLKSQETAA